MDGQIQLLKSADKDQDEQEVVRTYFIRWVLLLTPASWTQVESEEALGACIPHVFQRNISYYMYILSHISTYNLKYVLERSSTYCYIPVYTISYNLIPVGTIMYCCLLAHTLLGTRILNIVLSQYQPVLVPSIFLVSCTPE